MTCRQADFHWYFLVILCTSFQDFFSPYFLNHWLGTVILFSQKGEATIALIPKSWLICVVFHVFSIFFLFGLLLLLINYFCASFTIFFHLVIAVLEDNTMAGVIAQQLQSSLPKVFFACFMHLTFLVQRKCNSNPPIQHHKFRKKLLLGSTTTNLSVIITVW